MRRSLTRLATAVVALTTVAVLVPEVARAAAATPAPGVPASRQAWRWPFSSRSPWNMPIGSGARFAGAADPRVRALQAHSAWVNAGQYSHPIVTASSSDPLVTLQRAGQAPIALRIPAGAVPAGGSDGHLHVVDPSRRWVDETWATSRVGGVFRTAYQVHTDLTGSGVGQGGTRAYGGSAIGGLIRTWELQAGAIRHAVALAINNDQLRSGWVWPATAQDGDGKYAYRGVIPMGTLFAIPGSVDLGRLGLTKDGLVLARALRDYGAYVVDRGSDPTFYAEPSAEGTTAVTNLRKDARILRGLLRVVANNTSSSVGGGGTPRVALAPPL